MANEEMEDVSFLDDVSGEGFENIGQSETAVPMLLISQQLSQAVQDGKVPAGHFYNSVNGKDYGDNIDVIVVHFQKTWVEWKPNGGGFVGRHEVGSIPVTGDVYTGMKTEEGNDVIETWMYLCILPDHLEDGYVLFQSTRGNIRYLKGWNTQMLYLRTPKGKPAPIFAAVWNLKLGPDKNKAGQRYYSCNEAGKSSITRVGWVPQAVYENQVIPARQTATLAIEQADTRVNQEALESSSDEEPTNF